MARSEGAAKHFALYQTDPDKAHLHDVGGGRKATTLLLTTTGRKSGEQRTTPLIYKKVGDKFVIIASLGGAPNHPSWYLNLEANPDCHIQYGSNHLDARARIAQGPERDAMWKEATAQFSDYNDYQSRTERRIPVVVLEKR